MGDCIAVVGASSFSGRWFCNAARAAGYSVLEFSRPTYDLNVNATRIALEIAKARAPYIVNFAALNVVADSWKHFEDYYRTNVIGIARFVGAIGAGSYLRRFLQVSTPEVYGTTRAFLKEGAPFNPSTPYAISRAAADFHLAALFRSGGFPVLFTRTVNVYGSSQQPYRVIPKTVLKILRGERLRLEGGGVSTRSFIHIDDYSRAALEVLESGDVGETYHVATPVQTSIRDLVAKICALMAVDFADAVEIAPERVGKDMAYQLDDARIRLELGWYDRISLDDGLRSTVRWFVENARHYAGHSLEYEHKP